MKRNSPLVRKHIDLIWRDNLLFLVQKELEIQKALQEADKWALELANGFEVKRDLQVEVINVSSLEGKLKATARGISKTPTTAIGQERIEASSNMERLKQKLGSYFNRANP